MKKIAIIGLGNIGRHYMTGLSKLKKNNLFFFVDISNTNLIKAKNHWKFLKKNNDNSKFYNSLKYLPKRIDLIIISSTAESRLRIIQKLKKKSLIKFWILEKPISNQVSSLDKIVNLLNKDRVYINILRVYSKIYQNIKKKINKKNLTLSVQGTSWNIASNSIHFLYLYFWLKDKYQKEVKIDLLINSVYQTKRRGFYDFNGVIKIYQKKKLLIELISNKNNKKRSPVITKIKSDKKIYYINESNNKYYFKNKLMIQDNNFFQSKLTDKVVQNLIDNGNTLLPTLKKIYYFQKILLQVFKIKFSKHNKIT